MDLPCNDEGELFEVIDEEVSLESLDELSEPKEEPWEHLAYVHLLAEDVIEIQKEKENAAKEVNYNPTSRRAMDDLILYEVPLAKAGPCNTAFIPNFWDDCKRCSCTDSEKLTGKGATGMSLKLPPCRICGCQNGHCFTHSLRYCSPGGPYSTTDYPRRSVLGSDAAMAEKYGISVDEWRGRVSVNLAEVEHEKALAIWEKAQAKAKKKGHQFNEPKPVLPRFVSWVRSAEEEINGLREKRDSAQCRKELSDLNAEIASLNEELTRLLCEIGSDVPETIDHSDFEPFNYLPCSWQPQRENNWEEKLLIEQLRFVDLPLCEFGCPHVLVVMAQPAYEELQRKRGAYNPAETYLSSYERALKSSGKSEAKAIRHQRKWREEHGDELRNLVTYEEK